MRLTLDRFGGSAARVAAMMVLVVGLPTALLVAADLRELERDRAFVRSSLREAHRTQAAALAADVATQLRRRLARLHTPGDAADAAKLASALAEEKPFVRDPFWIDPDARLNGVISLPAPGRAADLPHPVGGGDPEAAATALREGGRAEHALKDRNAAGGAYRRALLLASEPGMRAHAAFALGRLAESAGKPAEAAPYYRATAMILGDGRDPLGIPYGLVAELRLAVIAPDPVFITGIRSRLAVALSPDEAAAFGSYLDRNLTHRGNASASIATGGIEADLRDRLWPLIRGKNLSYPAWIAVPGAGEPRLYGVAGGPREGYVGFRADLEGIASAYIPRWAQRVGLDPAAKASLLFLAPSASGSLEATLEAPFEFARATIHLEQDAVERRLRAQATRSLAALALLLTAIGAGAWALYRGISREITFARMQAAFVAGVSHELKTPLTAIKMYADLLALGMARDPVSAARTLVAEGDRLNRLIDRVLDFARIQRGTKTYNPGRVDILHTVEEALAILDPTINEEKFEVEVDAAPDLPLVRADRDALLQVVLNLVGNSLKYSGESRKIGVRLAQVPGAVTLAVWDRGIGIPKREQTRIFKAFHRAVPADGPGGSGLGLALVKEYVTSHGGEISVDSQPGTGSTFTVTWPTAEAMASSEEEHGHNPGH